MYCNFVFTQTKTAPSLLVANQVGNMYTPSLYGGLASFIQSHSHSSILGRRVILFSYGSGCAASMFSMTFASSPSNELNRLVDSCSNLQQRLDQRQKVSPANFAAAMSLRQETHHKGNDCHWY